MGRNQFQTSTMGLHYVSYKLAEQAWYVSAGKYKVTSPAVGEFWRTGLARTTFQVSVQRGKGGIRFNGGSEKIKMDFLIAVVNLDGVPEVYIFTADEARDKMIEKRYKDGLQGVIEVRDYVTDEFRDRWDKLEV